MKSELKNLFSRAAGMLLMMLLTTATAWAGTVDVTVNVTGSGSVSIGNQTATEGNSFTTSVDDGASVTLTFAPVAGNIVTSAKQTYTANNDANFVNNITISGSTATCQMPNDIKDGTGVTINVTFGAGLAGRPAQGSPVIPVVPVQIRSCHQHKRQPLFIIRVIDSVLQNSKKISIV